MLNEKELEMIHEDDRREIPDWIWNMTKQEREQELERLYKEMKDNPVVIKREPLSDGAIKFNI